MSRIVIIAIITLTTISTSAQVSSIDIKQFEKNLEIRRSDNVGMSLVSPDYLSVRFGKLVYNGVKAVSYILMVNAYPEVDVRSANGLFTDIGMNKTVFDKFIYQIFLYTKADKTTTVSLINGLCGDVKLSNKIYTKYIKEYTRKIDSIVSKTKQENISENAFKSKLTFDVPVKSDDIDSLKFKEKDIREITFLAKGVQFKSNGENGFDKNTEFEITINGSEIHFKSKYLDGYMLEEYIVDSLTLDKENKMQLFFLADAEKVKRHSFLDPAKIEFELQLYYDTSLGYFIEWKSLTGEDYKIFENQVQKKTHNKEEMSEFSIKYDIISDKSYFYTFEKEDSKRKAYVQKGDEVEKIGVEENGWIDCKFINSAGIKTEGYLKSSTLQIKENK